MPIHNKQIRPPVVVKVNAPSSPPHKRNRNLSHARRVRNIRKGQVSIIPEKRITLIFEIRHMDREAPGVIEIAYRDSHPRCLAAIAAYRRPRDITHIRESSVAVIAI